MGSDFCFFVRSLEGKTLTIQGKQDDLVSSIWLKLENRFGSFDHHGNLRLQCGHKQLRSEDTLNQAGVCKDSTVYILGRLPSTCTPSVYRCVECLSSLQKLGAVSDEQRREHIKHMASASFIELKALMTSGCMYESVVQAREDSSQLQVIWEFFLADGCKVLASLHLHAQSGKAADHGWASWLASTLANMFINRLEHINHASAISYCPKTSRNLGRILVPLIDLVVATAGDDGSVVTELLHYVKMAFKAADARKVHVPSVLAATGVQQNDIMLGLCNLLKHTMKEVSDGLSSLEKVIRLKQQDKRPPYTRDAVETLWVLAAVYVQLQKAWPIMLKEMPGGKACAQTLNRRAKKLVSQIQSTMTTALHLSKMCVQLRCGSFTSDSSKGLKQFIPQDMGDSARLAGLMRFVDLLGKPGDLQALMQHPLTALILEVKDISPGGAAWHVLGSLEAVEALPSQLRHKYIRHMFASPAYTGENSTHLCILRDKVLESSFDQIMKQKPTELAKGIKVSFLGEDARGEGVLKEWFTLVSRELFDPQKALFQRCPVNQTLVYPNHSASVQGANYLEYCQFAGRFVGLALRYRMTLGVGFSDSFFNLVAKRSLKLADVEQVDPQKFTTLQALSTASPEAVEGMGLVFAASVDNLGVQEDQELISDGVNTLVTKDNRERFVELYVKHVLSRKVELQVEKFTLGMWEMCGDASPPSGLLHLPAACSQLDTPHTILRPLLVRDMNHMILGDATRLCVPDWREHTDVRGFSVNQMMVVEWFWEWVAGLDDTSRRKLLQFWTATTHLPSGGFAALNHRLQVMRVPSTTSDEHRLPIAHTCFMQLAFPCYPSAQALKNAFNMALSNLEGSFGME